MIEVNRDNVSYCFKEFEYFEGGSMPGSFRSLIFQALIKADPINFYKLAAAFPAEGFVIAYFRKPEHLDKFREVAE